MDSIPEESSVHVLDVEKSSGAKKSKLSPTSVLPLRRSPSPVTMEKLGTKRTRIINRNWELPPHIHEVIFSKLSISYLSVCRLVCKTWNHLILDYASSSKFLSNILLFSNSIPLGSSRFCYPKTKIHCLDIDKLSSVVSFEFDDTVCIFNSCNGLLFITKDTYDSFCDGIFNPMTGEFFKLCGPEKQEDIYAFGFGFSPKTKQYKLFKVFTNKVESIRTMEILTIGRGGTNQNQNEWRHVSLPFALTLYHNGAYLNGVVYWIGRQKENECVIYGLDVETEKIESIAVLEVGSYSRNARIQAFNGTIYAMIFVDRFAPSHKIQVWRMRGKYLWVKDFLIHDVPKDRVFCLIKAVEDREILYLLGDELFCLNKTGRNIKIQTLTILHGRRLAAACPIESLNFGSLPNILAGDD